MPNYRLDIEYDGTDFCGWQIQPNARSVQEEIEKILSIILKENIKITGAGRTDSGVHAKGQVANFNSPQTFDLKKVLYSINSMISKDVTIKNILTVDEDFNARYSAKMRLYQYRVSTTKISIGRQYVWNIKYNINWEILKELMPIAKGLHDFSAFCNTNTGTINKMCDVSVFSLEKIADDYLFTIGANRFLYNMVRSVVGTLVDIGRGYLDKDNFKRAIESKERKLCGTTAPACGLTLLKVDY